MKHLLPLLALIPSLLFAQTHWSGSGTESDPYIITTADGLQELATRVNGTNNFSSGKYFELGADIVLNDTANWKNWDENNSPTNTWTAIGKKSTTEFQGPAEFQGTFDGGGYIISGVYINSESDRQGLFGYVGLGGTIKNLGVKAFYVKGNEDVGGLVGTIRGTITNSYATGNVVGNVYVGGLVGFHLEGTISKSYATGNVSGRRVVGGLAGYTFGETVANSYATGNVSGTSDVGGLAGTGGKITNSYATGNVSGTSDVGGLVGYGTSITNSYATGKVSGSSSVGGLVGNDYCLVTDSYYDQTTSGQSDTGSFKGEGKSTEEMQSPKFTSMLNAIAYKLSANKWIYENGKYPALSNEVATEADFFTYSFAGGIGSQENPYIITTKEHLELFAFLVNNSLTDFAGKFIALGNDIALGGSPENQWTAIGTSNSSFKGTFDGNGYAVSGIYISSTSSYQGLFGYVNGGKIKNLGVTASYVKGGNYIGGLAGYVANGTITNSYSIGEVSGTGLGSVGVGGLVGLSAGTITNSYTVNNGNGSYYDYTGSSASKTKAEMQSEDFAETLQAGAVILSANGWIYSQGEYPTISNTLAPVILAKENNQYTINTKLQLKYFSYLVNLGTHFNGEYIKLGANITLLTPWTAIGTNSNPFRGTFDGNGYFVSGVYINKTGTSPTTDSYQGLFGYIGSGGAIKNLGVVDLYVKGYQYVGGLAGYVTSGTITNSYATGEVSGTNYIGGLVGHSNTGSTIINSYAVGNVSGTGSNVGGFAGSNSGTINSSYYDSQTSGKTDTRGTPKPTAEMQSEDFAETLQIVAVASSANGWIYSQGEYPTLSNTPAPSILEKENNQYTINTKLQLKYFAYQVNSGINFNGEYIKLGTDIILNDTTANGGWQNWSASATGLAQWTAIGTSANSFQGTFDGNGHIVSGVYINSTSSYQGLFGYVNGGTIKNLGVTAFYVKGSNYISGLAGLNSNSTISNSYTTGNVSGSYAGGLAGYNNGSKISNSYATGTVSGTGSYIGGLAGYNISSTIENSYATVNVSGSYAGGLAGYNISSTIKHSYATGTVSGTGSYVGGLVGQNSGSEITNSYYNSQSPTNDIGTPKTTAEMQNKSTFADWDFDGTWGIGPNPNSGTPYLLWQSLIRQTEITSIPDQEYTGSQIKPEPSVSLNGVPLAKGTDFYYAYGENTNAGTGTVTAVGNTEMLFGEKTISFTILPSIEPPFPEITTHLHATFTKGLTLADIHLPHGYAWKNPETEITTAGVQSYKAEHTNANYTEKSTGLVSINISKGDGFGTASVENWAYSETANAPSASSHTHSGDTPVFHYEGRNGTAYSKSTTPPTNAGEYALIAEYPANSNYNSFTTQAHIFTIHKAKGTGYVSMANWYAGETAPLPVSASPTNGTEGAIYRYWSTDEKTYLPSPSVPSNPGSYTVEATFPEKPNYSSFKEYAAFEIFQITNVNVVWNSDCGANAKFTYNGTEQYPVPTAEGYELAVTGKQTNAGSHTATAQLATPSKGVSLQNETCPYTILPKPLTVTWETEEEYVYNKMTQGPIPSVSESGVALRVVNTYSGVGKYTDENKRAPYAEIISSNAANYELKNNSVDYEIKPKPLKPYFSTTLPAFEYNLDTLWVPNEVFADTSALQKILEQVISYEGFATDSEGNSDDASVLKGKPRVSIEYAASPSMLYRRVETTRKATAIIITTDVSADNYVLVRPAAIVIVETMEDSEELEKINCYRGSYCTELSKEVCLFIDGEEVPSCSALRKTCVIDDRCIENMLIGECTGINGKVAETACNEISTLRPQLSAAPFRVWQTASGMVSMDLGYMPATPVALRVYDLKGKLVATERVNTRFASVTVNVPSGVYLVKVGGRNAVAIL